MSSKWRNWAGSERAKPAKVFQPASSEETAELVRWAAAEGRKLKVYGSGHSFSGIAAPQDCQVSLDAQRGLLSSDRDKKQVTLAAGTKLHEIPALIEPLGLAMANLGDIDKQSIAGAFSSGTHGTGNAFGGIATQVAALTIVTGTGEVIEATPTTHPDIWPALPVNLGALGIITAVTLQAVDAFDLDAVEETLPLSAVTEKFAETTRGSDHFEFYWFPHTDLASTKRNTRITPGSSALPSRSGLQTFLDDEVLANEGFRALTALDGLFPKLVPPVNRFAAKTMTGSSFTGASHEIFVRSRRVRFHEMEYAFPRENLMAVFAELQQLISDRGWLIEFPVEVRTAAADELWMSTAYQRDTGYLAVHRHHRKDPKEYFTAFEELAKRYQGRPHWGKMNFLRFEDFERLYPRYGDFVAVRNELDPHRIFSNTTLDRILGA